jgi:hypothetical protein
MQTGITELCVPLHCEVYQFCVPILKRNYVPTLYKGNNNNNNNNNNNKQ